MRKGNQLAAMMEESNLSHISTGELTYWPSDRKRIADVLDFCIAKQLNINLIKTVSCHYLSSHNSQIKLSIYNKIIDNKKPNTLQ